MKTDGLPNSQIVISYSYVTNYQRVYRHVNPSLSARAEKDPHKFNPLSIKGWGCATIL